jgi:hypothetical protein
MKVEELEQFLDKLVCIGFYDGIKYVWLKGFLRQIDEDKIKLETHINTYFITTDSINQIKIPKE